MAETLQQWTQAKRLQEATLQDGTLSLGDESLDATAILNVSWQSKSCSYSLASLFLQLLDPGQSLVQYRKLCKKHGVTDPVKALDKPIVLGYFGGGGGEEEKEAEAAAAAPAPAAPPKEDAKKKKQHRHKDRDKKHSDRRRHKEPSSSSSHKKRKKQHKEINTAQLFSNLVE